MILRHWQILSVSKFLHFWTERPTKFQAIPNGVLLPRAACGVKHKYGRFCAAGKQKSEISYRKIKLKTYYGLYFPFLLKKNVKKISQPMTLR